MVTLKCPLSMHRAAGSEKREDQLPWAEEVLVTKVSLEEKQQRIQELESQVRPCSSAPAAVQIAQRRDSRQVKARRAIHQPR